MKRKQVFKIFICSICIFVAGFLSTGCSFGTLGAVGKSAYELAVDNGFVGTIDEWLASLRGENGSYAGRGLSAYEIAVQNGFVGTEQEWLASLNTFEDAFEVAMNKCLTSVVAVRVKLLGNYTSSGSGVIMEYNKTYGYAYVMTNYHVVCDESTGNVSSNIQTYLYGREYYQTDDNEGLPLTTVYVGGVPECDIAVLKVYIPTDVADKTQITVAQIGSSSRIAVGSRVGAIGNAKGKGISLTSGVVSIDNKYSTFERVDKSGTSDVRVIKFDAYITNGNSGGGLFNAKGEFVGLVSSKDESVEFYYAIPVNLAYNVYKNIVKNAYGSNYRATRLVCGVKVAAYDSVSILDETTKNLYIKEKVKIKSIDFSTGVNSYLSVGDEIISITYNGKIYNVDRTFDISDIMWGVSIGDTITIRVKRNSSVIDVQIPINTNTATNRLEVSDNIF